MDDNVNITQDEEQVLDSDDALDPDEQDDIFSAEIEQDDEGGYELTDEEILELADEEDDEDDDDASSDQDDADVEDADEQDGADSDAAPPDEGEDAPDEQSSDPDEENGAEGEGSGDGEKAEDGSNGSFPDYDAMAKQDLEAITRAFPGIGITDLRRIDNPGRYGALREMGLTPEEAFRATNGNRISAHAAASARARSDGKAHIRGDMPAKQASAESFSLTATQLRDYRELFPGKSDKEITELVRSVSKRK